MTTSKTLTAQNGSESEKVDAFACDGADDVRYSLGVAHDSEKKSLLKTSQSDSENLEENQLKVASEGNGSESAENYDSKTIQISIPEDDIECRIACVQTNNKKRSYVNKMGNLEDDEPLSNFITNTKSTMKPRLNITEGIPRATRSKMKLVRPVADATVPTNETEGNVFLSSSAENRLVPGPEEEEMTDVKLGSAESKHDSNGTEMAKDIDCSDEKKMLETAEVKHDMDRIILVKDDSHEIKMLAPAESKHLLDRMVLDKGSFDEEKTICPITVSDENKIVNERLDSAESKHKLNVTVDKIDTQMEQQSELQQHAIILEQKGMSDKLTYRETQSPRKKLKIYTVEKLDIQIEEQPDLQEDAKVLEQKGATDILIDRKPTYEESQSPRKKLRIHTRNNVTKPTNTRQYRIHMTCAEVPIKREEDQTAKANLKVINEDICRVIESGEKDILKNIPSTLVNQWIHATCKQLRSTFDYHVSIVKHFSCHSHNCQLIK